MEVGERIKVLLKCISEEERSGDTFAERAEWYYQKRPQLIALLQDLYDDYITRLDRCNRMEGNHGRHPSLKLALAMDQDGHFGQEEDSGCSQVDSEAESSLSYQQLSTTIPIQHGTILGVDELVADLVMNNVEKEIFVHQVSEMEQHGHESSRKLDLLKKLLEVLESERIVLLNENARLGYKVQTLLEENQGLSAEAMFLKRKAAELARCVLKMREDHRVCMLTRKIEDLQGQIYGLEERNKEYYQQLLMKRDKPEKEEKRRNTACLKEKNRTIGNCHVAFVGCFQLEKLKSEKENEAVSSSHDNMRRNSAKRVQNWWERVKSLEFFNCVCGS